MATEQQFGTYLRRWVEALNAKDWDAFDALVDEVVISDYVGHLPGAQAPVRGPEGLKQFFRGVIEAIPDYQATVEDHFLSEDKGAARFTARRTDPATGKPQRLTSIMISHFQGDKFAEDWELIGSWEDEE